MNPLSRRREILQEMDSITSMLRGKLSPMPASPYFRLQSWKDKANCTRYVPENELEAVRAAVANHTRFQALAKEFVDLTVAMTDALKSDGSKKNSRKRVPNSVRKQTDSSG